jgi:hypothetical protein
LTPHSKESTKSSLEAQLAKILDGAPSSVAAMSTATGVKDKYFQHFVDKLAAACAKIKAQQQADPNLRGHDYLIQELKKLRDTMPFDIFSPSLRLDGAHNSLCYIICVTCAYLGNFIDFDPNAHTPVEILHVVLLGFVKYFWRDAVSRQKAEGKEILKVRLSSFDMGGLGLSRAKGHTLVQYAGSLNGADFRLILQLAPSVLQGLIPDAAYQAWLALCRLAPLLFQPQISDRESYLVS